MTPTDKMVRGDDLGSQAFVTQLPWQQPLWQRLTSKFLTNDGIPHAILAGGRTGIGKRAFVWRWVAWQLCQNKATSPQMACGHCQSCQWLQAGNHPNLRVLPSDSLPIAHTDTSDKRVYADGTGIKVDDIRSIQDFANQGSQGLRIMVFVHAENMTVAAANALLKTLEEPNPHTQLILISDQPSKLLPTIRSRTQALPLSNIPLSVAKAYVSTALADKTDAQISQLLTLTDNAPMAAIELAQKRWYQMQSEWLGTWQALASQKRTPVQASDYWQSHLPLMEFIELSLMMLVAIQKWQSQPWQAQQKAQHQPDEMNIGIDLSNIHLHNMPSFTATMMLQDQLYDMQRSLKQNVQDKIIYDALMQNLAQLW